MPKQEIIQLSSSSVQQTQCKLSLFPITLQQISSSVSQKPLSISTQPIKNIHDKFDIIRYHYQAQKHLQHIQSVKDCSLDSDYDSNQQQLNKSFQQQWAPQMESHISPNCEKRQNKEKQKKITKARQKRIKSLGTQKKHKAHGKKKDQLTNSVFNAISQYFDIDF